MPTIYYRPRKRACPFHYRFAERMAMRKLSCFFTIFGMFDVVRITGRKAEQTLRGADLILPLIATLTAAMLQEELWLVRSTYFLPPMDISMPPFQSAFWKGDRAAVLVTI